MFKRERGKERKLELRKGSRDSLTNQYALGVYFCRAQQSLE